MHVNLTFHEQSAEFLVDYSTDEEFCISFEAGMQPPKCIPYEGSYYVTPRTTQQLLPTADRHLYEDITVYAIPYHEVGNVQRGTTAIIGE